MASSSSVLALPSAPTTQARPPSDQVGVYPYLDYYVCSYAAMFWVLNIQDDMLKSDACWVSLLFFDTVLMWHVANCNLLGTGLLYAAGT